MSDKPQPAPTITITLTREEAERISYGLADLLCWHHGFRAAREGTDLSAYNPLGVDCARDINLKIKDAL